MENTKEIYNKIYKNFYNKDDLNQKFKKDLLNIAKALTNANDLINLIDFITKKTSDKNNFKEILLNNKIKIADVEFNSKPLLSILIRSFFTYICEVIDFLLCAISHYCKLELDDEKICKKKVIENLTNSSLIEIINNFYRKDYIEYFIDYNNYNKHISLVNDYISITELFDNNLEIAINGFIKNGNRYGTKNFSEIVKCFPCFIDEIVKILKYLK